MIMKENQRVFLKELRSLLGYHQELDLGDYPGNHNISILKNFSEEQSPDEKLPVRDLTSQKVGNTGTAERLSTIDEIAEEVKMCVSCNLHKNRIFPIPGGGGRGKIKIFIIGGWLTMERDNSLPGDTLFGIEEDAMVDRMLKALHLSKEDAFITNCIKCGIVDTVQPVKENIEACSSYLFRQIACISPVIICTMGVIASRILLNLSRPLSQIRGRFYTYRTAENVEIPVLPTYHPTFLLQNPDMKKATWIDLQLIQKELQRKGLL